MPDRARIQLGAVASGAFLLVLFVCAPVVAQTPAEADCRESIAKATTGYLVSVLKAHERCHKKRSKGRLAPSIDCNDLAQADPAGRLANKRHTAIARILAGCEGAQSLLPEYARCPSPAADADDGGATDGIDDLDELGACMVGLAEGLGARAAREVLGAPAAALSKNVAKCQKTLGARFRKLVATYAKVRIACQHERDAGGLGLEYGCDGADGNGRIARVAEKLRKAVGKRCALSDPAPLSLGNEAIAAIGACGDTVAQLQSCLTGAVGDRFGSGAVAMAYGLPADCRAGAVIRVVNAGFGEQITQTSLSAGWNGLAHGIDFTDGFGELLALACDEDCASCAIGFNPGKGRPGLGNCRCAADASIACDTINGPDTDDCGLVNNQCLCYFGPPLGVNAAGVPACVPIRITKDYDGTVDVGSGDWQNPLQVAAVIHLGEELLQPCPACEGDIKANDGVRDGTCVGGARNALPCDANGIHPTFGGVSIDCQPVALKNISGEGLVLNFELLSTNQEMPFLLPCDDPPGGNCPCRVCSQDSTLGCRGDFECPEGTGTCTGGGGAGVEPTNCDDRVCNSDGQCASGPNNTFCDGVTHPNGRGAIACNTDADCAAFGAGRCTLVERLRCYPDPITVGGGPGIFGADLGGLACIGLTTSPAINVASGLPGAVRVALNVDLDVRCASDESVSWQPPAGANCPQGGSQACGDSFPLCGGTCPAGQTCTNTGLACACE